MAYKLPKSFENAQILFTVSQLAQLFGMTRKEVLGFLERQGIPSFVDGKKRRVTLDGLCHAKAPIVRNLLLLWRGTRIRKQRKRPDSAPDSTKKPNT